MRYVNLECPLCGEFHPDRCPDPAELARRAAKERERWDAAEHDRRLVGFDPHIELEIQILKIRGERVVRKTGIRK